MRIIFLLFLSFFCFADYKIAEKVNLKIGEDVILDVPGLQVFPYKVKDENKFVVNFESNITSNIENKSFTDSLITYCKVKLINNKTRLILIFKEPVKYTVKSSQVVFSKIQIKAEEPKNTPVAQPSATPFSSNTLQKIIFHNSNQPLELLFGYKPDFTLTKISDSSYTIEVANIEKPADTLLLPYYPNSEVAGIISVLGKFENGKLLIAVDADQKITAFSTDTGITVKISN